jgi:hypothetical protein
MFFDDNPQSIGSLGTNANHGVVIEQSPCRDARVKKSRKMPAVHLDFASARPRFRQIWWNYGMPSRLRSTPSFLMRPRRVLGLSFKIAAAPLGPSMRQLVCLRTSRMRSFSV